MSLNIRKFILPFSFALAFTILIQYFFSNQKLQDKDEKSESGRSYLAPRVQEVHRPLNTEIDFVDTKSSELAQNTIINTDYAKYNFSSYGAALTEIEYKHSSDNKNIFLKTFSSKEKEDRCLLIAFSEKTPFYYKLIKNEETAESYNLTYEAKFDNGTITKRFIVFKHLCKIDLEIDLSLTKDLQEPIRLRLFYPSPFVSNIDDIIQGVMNEGNNINKKNATSLLNRYWEIPSLFGLEDRYFIHSLVKDHNNFCQRAYYKSTALNLFFAILEGPSLVKGNNKWYLSFFFGPKKFGTIYNVDSRLERTLDYGWLTPLAKPLLAILNFFYKFFKNYGIAIILLTLLIKLLLLPFTLKSEQNMKKRLEFQKKLQYIQQKYKDDKEALVQARAELLKKQGLGDMAGCLPLLLQLPIFFALNRVLSSAIELYQAPFLWIPNLSAKDPFYILPILIGLSIVIHSQSTDPRQRFTTYGMALLLAAFSAGLPAGLSLFIFMSSILTVAQTKFYNLIKKA